MTLEHRLYRWDAEAVQMPLWDGLTRNGNLTRGAILHIENAIAEVTKAQECLLGMEAQVARLVDAQAAALTRCWLLLGDLRYMRPASTAAQLRERAEQWREEHVRFADEERLCNGI